MYNLEAMKRAIEKCDENIKIFEAAIDRELMTKKQYRHIIVKLEIQEEADK